MGARWVCLVGLLLSALVGNGQTGAHRKLDAAAFDPLLANQLVHRYINRCRDSLQVQALEPDSALQKAAEFHAGYLAKKGKVTHYQSKKRYHAPSDRVRYFGGIHELVGENAASIPVSAKQKLTYDQLARQFVRNWIKSKGHFKNLSSPRVYRTGVAVAYDAGTDTYVAVQVFGSMPIQVLPKNSPAHAYHLTTTDDRRCAHCLQKIDSLETNPYFRYGVTASEGTVYFSFSNLKSFRQAFRGPGYWFGADVLYRTQFPCGGPNQLHGSPYHDGFLIPPVRKRYLLQHREKGDGPLVCAIGTLPAVDSTVAFETNLYILRSRWFSMKKAICLVRAFSPSYGYDLDVMPADFPIDTSVYGRTLDTHKKLRIEIPFEKDKYVYRPQDIQPLIDSFQLNRYTIRTIQLLAYASVEGDSAHNAYLQAQRAETILGAFRHLVSDSMTTTIRTAENWAAFRKDIAQTPYRAMGTWEKKAVKTALRQDSLAEKLEPVLAMHRKAILYVTISDKITLATHPDTLLADYLRYIPSPKASLATKLKLQQQVVREVLTNRVSVACLDSVSIPVSKETVPLLYQDLAIKYLVRHDLSTPAHLWTLDSLAQGQPQVLQSVYGLLIEQWYEQGLSREKADLLLRRIQALPARRTLQEGAYYKLMVNYHIAAAGYWREMDEKKHQASVKYVLSTYKKASLSERDAYVLANFLVHHSHLRLAAQLMKPYVDKPAPGEDILFYYLSLNIYHRFMVSQEEVDRNMAKALEMNNDRFCQLFGYPALTFQLLREPTLKSWYCGHCTEQAAPNKESIVGTPDEGEKRVIPLVR